jgi:trehalose 6-phosphate phosphatase
MARESRADQALSAHPASDECATHKDAFLTPRESRPPPPLDLQSALFLDVDGTLLEIAPRPELVRVSHRLPALLLRLSEQRHGALALISGRPLAELDRLFHPWRGAAAGLHGIERRRLDGTLDRIRDSACEAALDAIRSELAALRDAADGLIVEDKGATLAVHYRAVPEREAEIQAYAEVLQREAGAAIRLIFGKMVVEFQPRTANKGTAIAAFLAEAPFAGRRPIFVGDDTTDEDGFAKIVSYGGLAVRVGRLCATSAGYQLPSVPAVLAWLAKPALP